MRSSPSEFPSEEAFWGNQLTRWPEAWLGQVHLSAEDASYLQNTGLPAGVDWHFQITPPTKVERVGTARVVLIHDCDVPLYVCEDDSTVVSELHGLVNSSVRQLGRFLVMYQVCRTSGRGLDETASTALIDRLELAMRTNDASAMEDSETFWPLIIEQVRHGLL